MPSKAVSLLSKFVYDFMVYFLAYLIVKIAGEVAKKIWKTAKNLVENVKAKRAIAAK